MATYQEAGRSCDDLISSATALFINELLSWLPREEWLADLPEEIVKALEVGLANIPKLSVKK